MSRQSSSATAAPTLRAERVPINSVSPDPANLRKHSDRNLSAIAGSLRRFGQQTPIVVDAAGVIRKGNGTWEAAKAIGWTEIEVIRTALKDSEAVAYAIADNRTTDLSEFDEQALADVLQALDEFDASLAEAAGYDAEELAGLLAALDDLPEDATDVGADGGGGGAAESGAARPTLADRFVVPPFSILDARQGYWQDRKRAWLAMGIQSELGRGSNTLGIAGALEAREEIRKGKANARTFGQDLMRGEHVLGGSGQGQESSGTSIFDPVLCELACRWFCPPGGHVLDPFAGGSVRGIVASKLGRRYTGIELRAEQIASNREQAARICQDTPPVWIEADAADVKSHVTDAVDFIFSCPPYADLEVYSDDPRDLSTMAYADFIRAYRSIVAAACSLLANDRFACFVVGDVRDKRGLYRNFPAHTIEAFQDAGLTLYNEAVLVTIVGSLPIRAGKQFAASRKLGKTHQNVLVFVKGDPRKATEACGTVEVGDLASEFGDVLGGDDESTNC